ncbi:DUF6538 domain-containing protein [Shinella sp. S4-D37]|uniref:DUF6538 domain-containing protein n=1 Tax=Shinella sp. S4-D37 TaxID=3161999 RepID=UPI0034652177
MKRFVTNRRYKGERSGLAVPSNVVRRGRMFHFRRVVPADLRDGLKRRAFVRTLGACSPRTARLRADELYRLTEKLFGRARAIPILTDDEITRLRRTLVPDCRRRSPPRRMTLSGGWWPGASCQRFCGLARCLCLIPICVEESPWRTSLRSTRTRPESFVSASSTTAK